MKKMCIESGCPHVAPNGNRCPTHARRQEAKRKGDRPDRGRYTAAAYKQITAAVRAVGYCAICHRPGTMADPIQADHIVPRSQGGSDWDISNYQPVHRSYNARKAHLGDNAWCTGNEPNTGLTIHP